MPSGAPSSYTIHATQPRQRSPAEQTARRLGTSPIPALALAATNAAALLVPSARRKLTGLPSTMQCTMYSAIFAASAYALASGDEVNGSGLAASWSTIWLFFNARRALKARAPLPIAIAAATVSVGSLYAYNYATIGYD
ncbi:hypothetical protein LPJ53_002660 [Coemansia erecta]|uniref:Uncharacterized protein n=1 Tax=Coemansia erecta TaxID=147472 RepID=A0A9W8CRN4_9FUNG|nr:hypothetical protein LPJ53_002660 [Coemansia erecta]